MTRTGRAVTYVAVLAALVLSQTACSSTPARSMSEAAARGQLRHDMLTLAAAEAAHDTTAARAALTALTADNAAAHTAGTISDARFASIRSAAAAVGRDLATASSPAATPSPSASATPPASASPKPAPSKSKHGGGDNGGGGGGGD